MPTRPGQYCRYTTKMEERYCESAKLEGTWRDVVQNANRAMAMDFLEYLCQTCRIKSWGSSWEYFRQYKQLYASATGGYIDRNDSREVQKWHDAVLVDRYGLQAPCIRGKDVANADTLLVLLTFNIKFDTGIFSCEGHRAQLPGCYLGLAFTGARLAIMYEPVLVWECHGRHRAHVTGLILLAALCLGCGLCALSTTTYFSAPCADPAIDSFLFLSFKSTFVAAFNHSHPYCVRRAVTGRPLKMRILSSFN
ncbi:hypothetical protein B0T26DRAFT_268683 [Lasiosphaeria miniovina]|uniref:Uncharacterized protein n=1 Tax=Lasiosphaeria miniovina TaxID=1954250 RepID=A0AA40DXP9_9PEZI|nr:uncharacterized protein B0T26DRAFT_268683 [Lasiosphaeria miniovina]KAK0716871.1 hypothetical protein B0T26DRAFT_268683 [Lasiosphaeria miniovina]